MQLMLRGFFKATSLQAKSSALALEQGERLGRAPLALPFTKSPATLKRESSTGTHSPYSLHEESVEGNILCLYSLIHNYVTVSQFQLPSFLGLKKLASVRAFFCSWKAGTKNTR